MNTKLNNSRYVITFAMLLMLLQACDNNNSEPANLNIETMTVNGEDLNGIKSPENISTNPEIVVTFNSDIKPETATESNIKLIQDYNEEEIEIEISVLGPTLTVVPKISLGNGILYRFQISANLLNLDEQSLTATTRTFTTMGTFSPPGIIAHYTFEGIPDDIQNDFDPLVTGVIDIDYTRSRNENAGLAATFNGTTSIIEIPNGDLLMNSNDFTICFWVKTDSEGHLDASGNPKGHFVMGLGAFFGFQYEIFSGYDGSKFAIQYKLADGSTASDDMWFPYDAQDATNGGWQGWDFAKSLSIEQMQGYLKDTWTHITFVHHSDSKKSSLYFNGELMKSYDFNLWPDDDPKKTVTGLKYGGSTPDVVNELALGFIHSRSGIMWDTEPWGDYERPTSNHFRGQLDDIKIYHKPLTPTEIQLIYSSEQ